VTLRRGWDNIKKDLKANGQVNMDWTVLYQDRDRWRAFVSMVMNVLVQQNVGNFF